jgi:2-polyprenyl-6-methoxyphenol hydroxylase-like FAD-dependent oxidoreductase
MPSNVGFSMRYTDIAIIGGGLAGSTAAAMLGRAGISTIVIDPHKVYPFDFRVEKIGGEQQVERFVNTGIADSVLRSATPCTENWIARFGRLLDKHPTRQFGIMYDDFVTAVRAEIRAPAEMVFAKVIGIATSNERQTITLSEGEPISARLIVLASGLSVALRHLLGIERKVTSHCHSISIGFDLVPVGRAAFDFPAMTYFSEAPGDRIPYITLFPVGTRMRANLFTYREADDPWLRQMRREPRETLEAALPRLKRITGEFDIAGDVKIRPSDLYVSSGHRQAGIVLVGDAFELTCPVTGTGTDKVFTDVERLCGIHIPKWLATEGMGADKIAAFYDDPVKQACDAWSSAKAWNFKSVSIDRGLYWSAQRWARFFFNLSEGWKRRLRAPFGAGTKLTHSSSSSSSSSSLSSSA